MRRILATIMALTLVLVANPLAEAAPARSLPLKIMAWPNPAVVDTYTRVSIQTTPAAMCSIVVWYASGPSHAKGLEDKQADGNGMVTWRWYVGSSTRPGTYDIEVYCKGDDDDVYIDPPFDVSY